MSGKNEKNRYALTVGHIAIEWNYLEHDLQQLGFRYLTVDAETAARIFAYLGNVNRAEFIGWLVDAHEAEESVRAHLHHFLKLYHRLRANRNVVEHGVPAVTQSGAYLDQIIKIDRRGQALPFAASQRTLDRFLKELCGARAYVNEIKRLVDVLADDEAPRPHPDEIEMPPVPNKLETPPHRRADGKRG